jgi:heat shock protein HslJ
MSMRLAVFGICLLIVGACASGAEGGSDDPELDGRQFVVTDVTGFEPVDDTPVSIRFDGDTIGLDAGCNSIGGSYSIDGGRLVVDDLFTTEIGCDPERHAQDEFLAGFVTSGPTVELAGDVLTLSDGNVTIEATDRIVADPDRPIIGTRWELDSIVEADAVSSVPGEVEAFVEFADDGSLSLFDGCNDGAGAVEVGEDELQIGAIASTRKACEGDSQKLVSDAYQVVLASGGSVLFEVDADLLTITNGDRGLVFRAAE